MLDAVSLALRLHALRLDLRQMCHLARRDERFAPWRRSGRAVLRGLRAAEAALHSKQPQQVEQLVALVEAKALPELRGVLQGRLESLRKQAETQRQFQEAYKATGEDSWAKAWGF